VLSLGYANADARTPVTPDTLFQIGSISKVMTALVVHQLAAEGRLQLSDRVSALLPAVALPPENGITVQHLLDHVAGIPGDTPMFVAGGLHTAYPPGAHWHYSNTGYDMLGKIAEQGGGKPLARLLSERVFEPLGMRRSRGAIVWSDRDRYAQGYEAADMSAPFVQGVPLAPAAWVDVTFGAGSVASTAEDMVLFMRALTQVAQGRGGLGLSAAQGAAFTNHAVAADSPGMRYGNGLMHVGNGGRNYLHHTGGMVSFSSAFHVDRASGAGAFASSNLSGLLGHRPRLLTRFAADALTNAAANRPPPPPPPLDQPLPLPAAYIGRYAGPAGEFEVRAGSPLTLVAGGAAAPLMPAGGDLFRSTHPRFRQFSLLFEQTGSAVTGASWGPDSYARAGSARRLPPSDPALARLAGRYVNDSPWWGPAIVVERGGRLWLGTETPMTQIRDNAWRVGDEAWSPERAAFSDVVGGRPQTLVFSGEKFLRHDV
jgi:CubicO group peptidase (beta-lactamase class C family)